MRSLVSDKVELKWHAPGRSVYRKRRPPPPPRWAPHTSPRSIDNREIANRALEDANVN
jgi:hypothetical protein